MTNSDENRILGIFEQMERYGHEQVIFNYDKATGLKTIIAIHNTTVGPALGGCRMWNYQNEQEALTDALRLARGMTYKCAVAGVNYGGGKTVIIGDPQQDKSDELFQALGTFIETLKGRYYTGTDMGTVGMDFVSAAKQTGYVVGLPEEYGGSGNSAVITAYGVWQALKATAKEAFGSDSLNGLTIAVQGVGKVGYHLLQHLRAEGAKMIITDILDDNLKKARQDYPEAKAVKPEDIYSVPCDIFSPNAMGGGINDETIHKLQCRAVCGAANNVLAEPRHGDMLHSKGVLYAPDYVANAGGLIQVADELHGFSKERAQRNTSLIYDTLLQIFALAKKQNIPPYQAADLLAEKKIEKIGQLKRKYTG